MLQQRGANFRVLPDPGVVRSQLRFIRGWAIAITVIGCWALLWAIVLPVLWPLALTRQEPSDPDQSIVPLALGVTMGVIALVLIGLGISMFVMRASTLKRYAPGEAILSVEGATISTFDTGAVPFSAVESVLITDFPTPERPALTPGFALANAVRRSLLPSLGLAQQRAVQLRLHDRRRGSALLGPHLKEVEFHRAMELLTTALNNNAVPWQIAQATDPRRR